jgi:isopenicillin N synthase-like dioxygenase
MAPIQKDVTIPVVDISGYLSGDPIAKKAIADEIREAYENQGFLQVIGHSVSPHLQARYLAAVCSLTEDTRVLYHKFKQC